MKLFVANVSFSASEEDLRELFSAVGPIKRLHLAKTVEGKSRGFAFLEFQDDLDASRALDDLHGHNFQGRRLVVQEASDGGQR